MSVADFLEFFPSHPGHILQISVWVDPRNYKFYQSLFCFCQNGFKSEDKDNCPVCSYTFWLVFLEFLA